MAVLGNLLTVFSVVIGVLAGATAYHASLDLHEDQLVGLTLAVGAGVKVDDDGVAIVGTKGKKKGKLSPLFKTGTLLDVEKLKSLRENTARLNGHEITVTKIKVNEFSFGRWSGKWAFLASVVGMLTGVMLTRRAGSREATELRESGKSEDLLAALSDAKCQLEELHSQLEAGSGTHAELHEIVEHLSELSADMEARFIDRLDVLRSVLHAGTMAEVLESYAVAERFSNRARSTAVDDDPHESLASLATAAERMGATIELLKKSL